MGWNKTSVNGRVMWESPDGQRVADSADVPEFRNEQSHSASLQPIFLSTFTTFAIGVLFGFVAGLITGVLAL